MSQVFDKGDLVRIYAKFRSGGAYVDPTTVKVSVKDPSGTSTDYLYSLAEVTKESTGVYYKDLSADLVGTYYVRTVTTGTYQAAQEDSFYVRDSEF